MSDHNPWPAIGTVVGSASTVEFSFILKSFKSRVGDLVAVRMNVPDEDYAGTQGICVWGRIVGINRFNPFFPSEAAQELSEAGLSLEDTILSNSRDQLEASALVLGCTSGEDNYKHLLPLTYPVQPAAQVLYPASDAIKQLLAGGIPGHTPLEVGTLIARRDVDIAISADRIVSRHMAILAMTGGGKTVAARRILRELIELRYPILILDPHGDYLGLWQRREALGRAEVNLYYPHISMTDQNRHIVEILISKMTEGLTEPQKEEFATVLAEAEPVDGESILRYIGRLKNNLKKRMSTVQDKRKVPTLSVCLRQLSAVENRFERMELTNERMRERLKQLQFQKMPDPQGRPEAIVAPGVVSILYLGGYDHLTQTTIASILLEALYEHRANLSNRIPPFLALIEEAHTFIPSGREASGAVPSLDTIRKLITEGRKFGTGLLLVTQRPSRVDETILSQCNSFLILRLVNPRDQNFVKQIMENLSEQDSRMLPGFGPGQGVISGQAVRFPLLVKIRMDDDLIYTDLGDENFLEQASKWKPDEHTGVRKRVDEHIKKLSELPERRTPRRRNVAEEESARVDLPAHTPEERWERARVKFRQSGALIGDLEAQYNVNMKKQLRPEEVRKYASESWRGLSRLGLTKRDRESLLELLEAGN